MKAALRLGVLIPCRNEAAVIGRKLRNLAQLPWPDAEHVLVIVEDNCTDDTSTRTRKLAAELFDAHSSHHLKNITVEVVSNDGRPGKAGAIKAGLAVLDQRVDLVLLTDADVVFREEALTAMEQAFAAERSLGMACGSQEFVASLSDEGRACAADGSALVPAAGTYDRVTASIRTLESRAGALFSIHGQLLGWRSELNLSPHPGIAADDLDLMCQVRATGLKIRKLKRARFLEVKTPKGPERRSQEIRRARAYVQVIQTCRLPREAPWRARAQFAAYRFLPLAAPWISLAIAATFNWIALMNLPHPLAYLGLAAFVIAALSPMGRRAIRLLAVISIATRLESTDSLDDSWEMERVEASRR
jgi:glycosyltransferase involved in cell wall biosynthesis